MSNEISDEAWERAALKEVSVDWRHTFEDGDKACFFIVERGRNGLPLHGLTIYKNNALAAQAELDAANEVTDEMIDVIDRKLFGSSILEKSGIVARHNHRENIREALDAALEAKTNTRTTE